MAENANRSGQPLLHVENLCKEFPVDSSTPSTT